MKRLIILFSVLAVLCSCLAVPSFAAEIEDDSLTPGETYMAFPLNSGEVIYTPVLTYEGVSVFDSSEAFVFSYDGTWLTACVCPGYDVTGFSISNNYLNILNNSTSNYPTFYNAYFDSSSNLWIDWSKSSSSTIRVHFSDSNFWALNLDSGVSLPSGGPPGIYLYTVPVPVPYNPVPDASSLVTNAVNWVSSMAGLVMNNPLILAYALLPILGVGIGLLVRSKNSNK